MTNSYWLFITSDVNWDVIEKNNLWGSQQKFHNTLNKVKMGDLCLIYVKQRVPKDVSKITGLYKATSGVYIDNNAIFTSPKNGVVETFPLRINLEPIRIYKNIIDFKKIVQNLIFIKNKKRWALYFFGREVIELPVEDFNTIINYINGNSEKSD
jgi:predicted RNA-binding protein